MKTLAFSFLAIGLVAAALPLVAAQGACQTEFTLVGQSAPDVWTVDGQENPTLTACPGEEITFNIQIASGVHNFVVQGVDGAPASIGPFEEGAEETYTMTAPADGQGTYICEIHPQTMKGTVTFAQSGSASSNGGGETEENESPGFGLVAALGALALVGFAFRRRA